MNKSPNEVISYLRANEPLTRYGRVYAASMLESALERLQGAEDERKKLQREIELRVGRYNSLWSAVMASQPSAVNQGLLGALKAVLQWIDDQCETTGFEVIEAQADAAIAAAEQEKTK